MDNLENFAEDNCILNVVAGSNAYGMNTPTSDWDERGIFIDNFINVLSGIDRVEQVAFQGDKVYFEFSKYMHLLSAQNPNILEIVWADPKDIIKVSDIGQNLIDNREKFLTKDVKDSYIGYAMQQLQRIKGHYKWMNNPQPVNEPKQEDYLSVVWNYTTNKDFNKTIPKSGYSAVKIGNNQYVLFDNKKVEEDSGLGWIDRRGTPIVKENSFLKSCRSNNINPDMIVKVNFSLYENDHKNWKNYWDWKKNRNIKRSELEEKFGYDTKHASHLVRLLKMGNEILRDGIVIVKRPDAKELLEIRNGRYSYEEIIQLSNELLNEINNTVKKTELPPEVDKEFYKNFIATSYQKHWEFQNNPKINIASPRQG